MDEFERALMRLKQALGIRTDKDVAHALGMSPTALNERKKRDSFPEERVRVAAQRNPDWKLDVDYVLTGSSPREAKFSNAIDALREATAKAQGLSLPDRERMLVRDVLWAASTGDSQMLMVFLDDYCTERSKLDERPSQQPVSDEANERNSGATRIKQTFKGGVGQSAGRDIVNKGNKP